MLPPSPRLDENKSILIVFDGAGKAGATCLEYSGTLIFQKWQDSPAMGNHSPPDFQHHGIHGGRQYLVPPTMCRVPCAKEACAGKLVPAPPAAAQGGAKSLHFESNHMPYGGQVKEGRNETHLRGTRLAVNINNHGTWIFCNLVTLN